MTQQASGTTRSKSILFKRISLLALSLPVVALAAPPPLDAGRLLREQPKAPSLLPGAPQSVAPSSSAEQPAEEAGPKFLVKGFRIEGATLIPEAELQAQLKESVGKELSFRQLQVATLVLTGYYAEKGYLARVILPPQEVEGGIVLIKIIEGQRGQIEIDNKGARLNPNRVKAFIDHRLAQGDKMNLVRLGEALTILNEQPGIEVTSNLAPGNAESDINLLVAAKDKPLVDFQLGANNHGSRGTGEHQMSSSLVFNNPFGLFDAASVILNASEGIRFLRAEYGVAIGNSGLRASVNASGLDYDVVQKSLSALDSHGNAITAGVSVSYPLVRKPEFNLSLGGSYDHKLLRDYTVVGETGDRNIDVMSLGLSGDKTDSWLGGGKTGFGVTLTQGDADLSGNAGALAADLATRRTDGSFTKLGYQLSRQQRLLGNWTLAASLSGQFAADNLDSTERFALGGPNGVRAYPLSEGMGDSGWLGSVNLAYNFSDALNVVAFIDGGSVRLNHNTYANWNAGNPRLDNTYTLSGGGVAANWNIAQRFALNATVATPFGNNPGRDTNGNDVDNRSRDVRGWVSLTATF